ncbi:MAG: SufD family Fe-S cluster assembly protein, partial [bacterium]
LTNGNTRNDVEVDMHGEGAEVWLGGMLLGDKEQRCENFTTIRHKVSNCRSEELYKYIVDDKAVAGFSGRILVEKGAQKTESHQTNRNISLSKEARILGRPQLEIYADDVKCGHGATTGMLDQSALFYMQQRGIALKEARLLLLQAFSADVVDKIHIDALRDRLYLLIESRLRGEEMRCAGCREKCS